MKRALLLLAIAVAVPARAECTFKTGRALVCRGSAENAAIVFKSFGFDSVRADESYNKQLLRQSDCAQLSKSSMRDHPIDEVRSGRVATATGWVEIMQFSIQDKMSEVFVARDYLSGTCRKESARQE